MEYADWVKACMDNRITHGNLKVADPRLSSFITALMDNIWRMRNSCHRQNDSFGFDKLRDNEDWESETQAGSENCVDDLQNFIDSPLIMIHPLMQAFKRQSFRMCTTISMEPADHTQITVIPPWLKPLLAWQALKMLSTET
ncbi:hypothetical protein Ancab_001970 [Ancistrocladus abbreviatus]